ncbi:MAG: Txe/YoeB family addiction module toxin [Propionibacteriaceae bacterium]|nr:Txe/YoeB family addiction module toxin [Propionibacteriaceae bacterium]
MKITFTENAWDEFCIIANDRRLLKRLTALLVDIGRGGSSGIGKPEQLRGEFAGFWSRRIDERQRLVYRTDADAVIIIQCHGHYQDR